MRERSQPGCGASFSNPEWRVGFSRALAALDAALSALPDRHASFEQHILYAEGEERNPWRLTGHNALPSKAFPEG